jgi:hypothetical protein
MVSYKICCRGTVYLICDMGFLFLNAQNFSLSFIPPSYFAFARFVCPPNEVYNQKAVEVFNLCTELSVN